MGGIEHRKTVYDHNADLETLQGGTSGEKYHLTETQESELTGAADTALHYHDSDRARANHTGTQAPSTLTSYPYLAYDNTGNTTITGATTVITLQTEAISDANYGLSGYVVTITAAGIYQVSYGVTYDITDLSGGATGTADAWIQIYTAPSWGPYTPSLCRDHHNERSGGGGVSGTTLISISASDQLRLVAKMSQGTTTIDTKANCSWMSLLRVG